MITISEYIVYLWLLPVVLCICVPMLILVIRLVRKIPGLAKRESVEIEERAMLAP